MLSMGIGAINSTSAGAFWEIHAHHCLELARIGRTTAAIAVLATNSHHSALATTRSLASHKSLATHGSFAHGTSPHTAHATHGTFAIHDTRRCFAVSLAHVPGIIVEALVAAGCRCCSAWAAFAALATPAAPGIDRHVHHARHTFPFSIFSTFPSSAVIPRCCENHCDWISQVLWHIAIHIVHNPLGIIDSVHDYECCGSTLPGSDRQHCDFFH
mmetsp:Transcript_42441/g.52224  ORF Transcript_42441/g.52224 Transcript_42441/m.52224 type:complete len:214 (-) Transcript_42441:151-792(-)